MHALRDGLSLCSFYMSSSAGFVHLRMLNVDTMCCIKSVHYVTLHASLGAFLHVWNKLEIVGFDFSRVSPLPRRAVPRSWSVCGNRYSPGSHPMDYLSWYPSISRAWTRPEFIRMRPTSTHSTASPCPTFRGATGASGCTPWACTSWPRCPCTSSSSSTGLCLCVCVFVCAARV